MTESLKVETSSTGTNGGVHVYVAVPGGPKVAAVWGDAESRFDRAYLFAAAPELRQCLEIVHDANEDCRKDSLPTFLPPMVESQIKAALAKAAGLVR